MVTLVDQAGVRMKAVPGEPEHAVNRHRLASDETLHTAGSIHLQAN